MSANGTEQPDERLRRQDRLWQLTLHEDDVFNSRQNLFLVAESMLVVAYTTVLGVNGGDSASVIAVVALLLTLAWLYASARHAHIVDHVQTRARNDLPDYENIYSGRTWCLLPFRSRVVTAYVVPLLIEALWIALLLAQP